VNAFNLPFTKKMLKRRALWGKSSFRVKDSLKAGAAHFAAAVNHVVNRIAGWVIGRDGRGAETTDVGRGIR